MGKKSANKKAAGAAGADADVADLAVSMGAATLGDDDLLAQLQLCDEYATLREGFNEQLSQVFWLITVARRKPGSGSGMLSHSNSCSDDLREEFDATVRVKSDGKGGWELVRHSASSSSSSSSESAAADSAPVDPILLLNGISSPTLRKAAAAAQEALAKAIRLATIVNSVHRAAPAPASADA